MPSNKETIKKVKITPPAGWEVDEEKSTFTEIVYKEIPLKAKLPTKWEELGSVEGYFVSNYSQAKGPAYCIANSGAKNAFSTKEEAEASIAMAQLSQLRKVYRDGWVPNWADTSSKYTIDFDKDTLTAFIFHGAGCFLSFQSEEVRDEFLKNFKELIMQAKPLLS